MILFISAKSQEKFGACCKMRIRVAASTTLLLWLLELEWHVAWCFDCPGACQCFTNSDHRTLTVDCSGRDLLEIPYPLPNATTHLSVSLWCCVCPVMRGVAGMSATIASSMYDNLTSLLGTVSSEYCQLFISVLCADCSLISGNCRTMICWT